MVKKTPLNFEAALLELNKIVEAMEHGNLNLDDALKQFERGIQLTRECQATLENAQQKVKMLIKQDSGDELVDYANGE